MSLGIGLLGLGKVGAGVARILLNPEGRHSLVDQLEIKKIGVNDLEKDRLVLQETHTKSLPPDFLTDQLAAVVNDPDVDVVVEMLGGQQPALDLILQAIDKGKPVVTANKTVIAYHWPEISKLAEAKGVYVLMEAAVGGGMPIIEPLKRSLGANRIQRIVGIINGTTNHMLTGIVDEGMTYVGALKDAEKRGYVEADPTADVDGLDAADKITILAGLAYGGLVQRQQVPTVGIRDLQTTDMAYADQLGYTLKLLATAAHLEQATDGTQVLDAHVYPTLVPKDHPMAGVKGVNNAVLVEGEPVGKVMFYGPGAGSGPTASAVVADILNIAAIRQVAQDNSAGLNPLLAAARWGQCRLANDPLHSNYVRLEVEDRPGVLGEIGKCFGEQDVNLRSIIQKDKSTLNKPDKADAVPDKVDAVVVTHQVKESCFRRSLAALEKLDCVISIACKWRILTACSSEEGELPEHHPSQKHPAEG